MKDRKPKLRLTVQSANNLCDPPSRARVKRWMTSALERDAEITVRFVDRTEARDLNRKYRGRDYATNVLSFLYDSGPPLSGDIALCLPVLADEAKAAAISVDARVAHLLVHAVLHLQGFDHEREEDARVMEARESEIVTSLGFADPYRPASETASRFSGSSGSARDSEYALAGPARVRLAL